MLQKLMKQKQLKLLCNLCTFLGFILFIGSIGIWLFSNDLLLEAKAHGHRLGIFVGVCALNLLFLSNYFDYMHFSNIYDKHMKEEALKNN